MADDAFITYRYVSNAMLGRGLVWNPAPFLPVDGNTDFLWSLLLLLTWQFGVFGAAVSRVLAEALSAGIFGWTVIRAIGKRIGAQPATPVAVASNISTDRA